jgi:segregation and condensation protein A
VTSPVTEVGAAGEAGAAEPVTSGGAAGAATEGGAAGAATSGTAAGAAKSHSEQTQQSGFQVRLSNFEGPFDLLLQLIFAHRLDVTEVALHQVTDDFIAYTKAIGPLMELDETTAFLVVAATLLDLKAARLLPSGEVHDEEDLALLEVRDLLFARLLQDRAYKHVAVMFAELEAAALRSYPRSVALEQRYEDLLPEVMLGVDADSFAQIAAAVFTPRPAPTIGFEHLHQMMVSVPEQIGNLMNLLENRGIGQWASFSELVADCAEPIEIVGRFLALLELYRARAVAFDQSEPLGVLQVSWTGERPTNDHVATEDAVEVEDADD